MFPNRAADEVGKRVVQPGQDERHYANAKADLAQEDYRDRQDRKVDSAKKTSGDFGEKILGAAGARETHYRKETDKE